MTKKIKYDKITEEMIPFLKKHIYALHVPIPVYDYLFSRHIIFVYQLIQERKKNLLKIKKFKPKHLIMLQHALDEFGVGLKFGTCFSKNEIEEKLFSDENFKREFEKEEYLLFIFLLAGCY